jgi:hypothetical protein
MGSPEACGRVRMGCTNSLLLLPIDTAADSEAALSQPSLREPSRAFLGAIFEASGMAARAVQPCRLSFEQPPSRK